MGELTSKATDLTTELATPATVAMNLLVYLQESVKAMESGLEIHQLVKVSLSPESNYAMTVHVFKNIGRCPTLSNPSNGRVDQRDNRPGAIALYTCNSGYELVGQSSRTCQNNGQWSGDAPTCESKAIQSYSIMICDTNFTHYSTMLHPV